MRLDRTAAAFKGVAYGLEGELREQCEHHQKCQQHPSLQAKVIRDHFDAVFCLSRHTDHGQQHGGGYDKQRFLHKHLDYFLPMRMKVISNA